MASLKEVAAAAGVSTVTASSVLSGANRVRVSEDTRQRLFRIAREMNYVPRAAARGLRTGRANAVAFLTAGGDQQRWEPYWQEMLRGISDVLWDRQENLILSLSKSAEHEEEALRQLAFGHMVDGLILQSCDADDPRITMLSEANVPFVAIGGEARDVALVDFDVPRYARLLAAHLLDDCGSLAVIASRPGRTDERLFLETCRQTAAERNAPYHEWTGAFLPEADWLQSLKRDDGSRPGLLLTRHLLPELVGRLRETDLQPGRDVRIVYLARTESPLLLETPGIEVLRLDYYTLGRRAAQFLFRMIDEKDNPPPREPLYVFPATLEHLLPAPTA
jgi:DNA-binding LacI/PurR family transcriptional regulator